MTHAVMFVLMLSANIAVYILDSEGIADVFAPLGPDREDQ